MSHWKCSAALPAEHASWRVRIQNLTVKADIYKYIVSNHTSGRFRHPEPRAGGQAEANHDLRSGQALASRSSRNSLCIGTRPSCLMLQKCCTARAAVWRRSGRVMISLPALRGSSGWRATSKSCRAPWRTSWSLWTASESSICMESTQRNGVEWRQIQR